MLRLSSLVVLLAMLPAGAQQRNPPPTPAQFHAALETRNTSQAQWLKSIDSVKIEELPVSYAIGKQFEESKALVTEDLKIGGAVGQSSGPGAELMSRSLFPVIRPRLPKPVATVWCSVRRVRRTR